MCVYMCVCVTYHSFTLAILIFHDCMLLLVGSGVDIYVFAYALIKKNLKVKHLMDDMDNLKIAPVHCMGHIPEVWLQENLLEWQPKPMCTGMYTHFHAQLNCSKCNC